MSDPINRDFSRWLKGEIATRFRVPVRYVLYTHRDWDHASGGVVFADTAQFVGHVNMLAGLAAPAGNPPLPSAEAALDTNRNGLIERAEATGTAAVAQRFDLFDDNKDGVVNGAEIERGSLSDVYRPTTTYAGPHEVTLGGKRVRLVPLGAAHSDDSVVLHFPDERAVFSADILQVKRLPQAITPTVGSYRRAPDHQRNRLRARAHRARACRTEAGRGRPAAIPGGVVYRGRGRRRRRKEPVRNPADADARQLQGVRALGHVACGAHRVGLRDAQGQQRAVGHSLTTRHSTLHTPSAAAGGVGWSRRVRHSMKES